MSITHPQNFHNSVDIIATNIQEFKQESFLEKYYISPSFSNKFVYFNTIKDKDIQSFTLRHSNIDGQTLYIYQIVWQSMPMIVMFTDDILIATKQESNELIQINLRTHQIHRFHHKFISEKITYIKLQIFVETELICVQECTYPSRLKLTYYNLADSQFRIPVASFNSTQIQSFQFGMQVGKANACSMIIWYGGIAKQNKISFSIFELDDDLKEGKYYQIQAKFSQNLKKQLQQIYDIDFSNKIFVHNIWENKKGQFLFQCTEIKKGSKLQYTIDKELRINNKGEDITIYEGIDIDYYTHQILCSWLNQSPRMIYICNCQSLRQDVLNFMTIDQKFIYSGAEVALQFLLQLNEDFDDDLLKDAVELINYLPTQNEQKLEHQIDYTDSIDSNEQDKKL